MKWNVFVENFNRGVIEKYNIFQYESFVKEIKNMKKKSSSKEEFEKMLDRELMYRFGSKCEWEIVLSDWPPSERFKKKKIDVYEQIHMNWEVFVDYVWNNV
jgi:hypothetical protein